MTHKPFSRPAFTVVEALVALAILGIAGGFLSAAFTVATIARRRAELDSGTAVLVDQRMALLARRSCARPDTAGFGSAGVISEWWTAHRIDVGWTYSESVAVAGVAPRAALRGSVSCF